MLTVLFRVRVSARLALLLLETWTLSAPAVAAFMAMVLPDVRMHALVPRLAAVLAALDVA